MKEIIVRHSSIQVPEYEIGDCEQLERALSVWDEKYFRVDPIGMDYDADTKTLYLPRGLDIDYLERVLNRHAKFDYKCDNRTKIKARLRVEPINDLQRKSIAYLIGEGEFAYTAKRSQLALNLTTGSGKTYCTVASIVYNGELPMILTHSDAIKNQWTEAFDMFTDIYKRDICDINKSSIITKLMNTPTDKLRYKAYIANRQTIKSYASKHGWKAVGEFFNHLGIGVKVFDEVHLHFKTNLLIDFHTNTHRTVYLTATLARSDSKENKLFKLAYKNIAKYGEESRKVLAKHIIYMPVFFNSRPTYQNRIDLKGRYGFNLNGYADYLVENDEFLGAMEHMIEEIIKLIGPDKKIVIMTATISSTFKMKKFLEELYPDKNIGVYNSEVSDDSKAKYLVESDIICSTSKSLGTGNDVKDLKALINCEPYSSQVLADQMPGRLRNDGSNRFSLFVEMVDRGFENVMKMYKSRQKVFVRKCAKVFEYEI